MKFYNFHLFPYPEFPDDAPLTYPMPNKYFDPVKGHVFINQYLDQLAYSETVGFDGVVVNEHHGWGVYNAFSPSPNLIAAIMTQRIKKGKIVTLGNAIPLYGNPLRVAEELSMLDVISGGRLIAGFVRGGANEYITMNVNPAESKVRFEEAWDLIVRAWTENEPFSYEGKYYRERRVSIWPRPIQKPHPPIWVPTVSGDTVPLIVKKRAATAMVYTPSSSCRPVFEKYRELASIEGYTPPEENFMTLRVCYVSDTNKQAMNESEKAFDYFQRRCLGSLPQELFSVAGHSSPRGVLAYLKSIGAPVRDPSLENAIKDGRAIVGSPETVKDLIAQQKKELGLGAMMFLMQFGNLKSELVLRSMKLLGDEVIPKLRSM